MNWSQSDFHSQMPWCEYPGPRCRSKVPVALPRTADDSEFHTGIVFKFVQAGDQLELVEAWRISGRCSEVMDENAIAAPFELLCQEKTRRFLGNMRLGLVGDAENRDRVARLDHVLHFLDELLLGSLVDPVRSFGQRRLQSDLP